MESEETKENAPIPEISVPRDTRRKSKEMTLVSKTEELLDSSSKKNNRELWWKCKRKKVKRKKGRRNA